MVKRKFYFFDVGIYRTLRPKGPLDSSAELNGAAFETLCVQELMALNHYLDKEYTFYHWRTRKHEEVDLILYGEHGLKAFEFKSSSRLRDEDFTALNLFKSDYPEAECFLVYGGSDERLYKNVEIISATRFFKETKSFL